MAPGDTSVQIVEAPINATTVKTAVDAAITATSASGTISLTSFNDGRGLVVVAVDK